MTAEKVSPWSNPDHPPCPEHGRAYADASGRCMPSCGFGWERDPILLVRDAILAARAEQESQR